MEQLVTIITDSISQYISISYLIVLIFLSYGLRDIIGAIIGNFTPNKTIKMYSVFIIATLLAFIWLFLFKEEPIKLFVTYAVGTSLYELIIKAVIAKFSAK